MGRGRFGHPAKAVRHVRGEHSRALRKATQMLRSTACRGLGDVPGQRRGSRASRTLDSDAAFPGRSDRRDAQIPDRKRGVNEVRIIRPLGEPGTAQVEEERIEPQRSQSRRSRTSSTIGSDASSLLSVRSVISAVRSNSTEHGPATSVTSFCDGPLARTIHESGLGAGKLERRDSLGRPDAVPALGVPQRSPDAHMGTMCPRPRESRRSILHAPGAQPS